MPGGVALLDYNNDGLLDIFVVNGGHISSPMPSPETLIGTIPDTGIGSIVRTKTAASPT